MPTTTVPVLPCADPDATVAFYEGLGFTVIHRQHRPYLYLAFLLDDIRYHAAVAAYLERALVDAGGRLAGCVLAAVNMVGGFVVTDRMLQMFTRRKKPAASSTEGSR